MKVNGDCKKVAFAALLSVLLVAVPALCEEDEVAAKTNLTKSSNIASPGLHGVKPVALGKESSSDAQNLQWGSSSSSKSEEEKGHGSSDELTDSNEGKEVDHLGQKDTKQEANVKTNHSSSAGSDSIFSFLFGSNQEKDQKDVSVHATPTQRNSSIFEVDDSSHNEKHQLHQASDDDEADLNTSPLQVPKLQQNNPDSVIVSSDAVPVRVGPNAGIRDNNQNNKGFVGLRKPIPIVRQDAATKDGSGQVIVD